MQLGVCIKGFYEGPDQPALSMVVQGVSDDSRTVKEGDVFLAYPGADADGRHYVKEAVASGAVAVLYEPCAAPAWSPQGTPFLPVPNLAQHRAMIAARFYSFPARSMKLLGVTGTNGKSSCVHFLSVLCKALNTMCWQIGTLGVGSVPDVRAMGLTTPGAVQLQAYLAQARDAGADAVAMEVSSHAIAQQRTEEVAFDAKLLTQVGHDHLDYHGTQAAYEACKSDWLGSGQGKRILNLDDAVGQRLAKALLAVSADVRAYAHRDSVLPAALLDPRMPLLRYAVVAQSATTLTVAWSGPWGSSTQTLPLCGAFQASNVSGVILGLLAWGYPWLQIMSALPSLTAPPGRMQCIRATNGLRVVIDYAHTPDALEAALSSLRACPHGRLWCIVGCGGDRDACKRPLMARAAELGADRVVLTSDNPRSESPDAIIAMMRAGLKAPEAVTCVPDRADAIAHAVVHAAPDDVILLAGKGHESVQWVRGQALPFDEVAWVQNAFSRLDEA